MRGALRLLFCGAVVAPALVACGGTPSFPEPAECIEPDPLPTSTEAEDGISERTYKVAMEDGLRSLVTYLLDFRGEWPSGNFSRQVDFRTDFANYADRTRCLATYLRDIEAPLASLEAEHQIDAALDQLLVHTEAGREAVRTRNVSEWREWRDGVDQRMEAVRAGVRRLD